MREASRDILRRMVLALSSPCWVYQSGLSESGMFNYRSERALLEGGMAIESELEL